MGSKETLSIKEGYAAANEYFSQVGQITRQLGLAGIAVIWVFKSDTAGQQVVPNELFLPGLLLVSGLGLDLIQYVIGGEIWVRITRSHEKSNVSEFSVAPWVNYFGTAFYWAKIISILSAYWFLIRFLTAHLFKQ